jgi:rare lipoprotein A
MNQHRWTCTTIVALTSVLAPIANVCAQASVPVGSGSSIYPVKSLPIITPLTVTELETDVAVPQGSSISSLGDIPSDFTQPITPFRSIDKSVKTAANPRKVAPVKPATFLKSPQVSTTKIAATVSTFTKGLVQQKKAIQTPVATPSFEFDNPGNAVIAQPGKISPLPIQPIAAVPAMEMENRSQSFTVKADSTPLSIVHNGHTRSTKIINTVTIQAEVARLPQAAPSISQTDDLHENLGFEAGTPTFVFDSERPQQIIATAIAQVDNKTVAPEPSIAIPVQRPNRATVPTVAPLPGQPIEPNGSPSTPAIQPTPANIVATQTGQASWYGIEGGPKTANGENYNPEGLTAAHRTLPFGTKVRVTSLKTGLAVTLRINDRGPFHSRRILDVSAGAAKAIGIKNDGIGDVKMEILGNEG